MERRLQLIALVLHCVRKKRRGKEMQLIPEVSRTPVGPEAPHTRAPGPGCGRAAWPRASPGAAQHEELAQLQHRWVSSGDAGAWEMQYGFS